MADRPNAYCSTCGVIVILTLTRRCPWCDAHAAPPAPPRTETLVERASMTTEAAIREGASRANEAPA